MAIDKELEAKILRYHHVEKWKVGTISRQLAFSMPVHLASPVRNALGSVTVLASQ